PPGPPIPGEPAPLPPAPHPEGDAAAMALPPGSGGGGRACRRPPPRARVLLPPGLGGRGAHPEQNLGGVGRAARHRPRIGGPGGLATAYWLSRHGAPVTVFERAPVVGGLARTVERDGYRFDIGGHRWFSKVDAVNDLYREVVGDESIWVHRTSRIYFDGQYID